MKKLFITLIMIAAIWTLTAQPGRVKIYFNGFVCDRETWDDILHLDGKCDEVFLTFQISVADANGNTKLTYEYKTPTYGDANGAFGNRISAGSCVDLFGGAKGGIRGGDRYLTNDLIGEFDIASTDLVSVVPVLWEWDPEQVVVDPLLSALKSATATISRETAKFPGSTSGAFSPVVSTINDVSKFIFPANIFMVPDFFNVIQTVVGQQGTRPIGVTAQGNFSPNVMVLSPQLMTNNSKINMGYGAGVVPVKYFETELGNEREHGNYLVLMRAEFTPSATTTTTATATPVMLQGTVMPQTVTYQIAPATTTTSQPASSTTTSTATSTSTGTSAAVPATTSTSQPASPATTTTSTTTTNTTTTVPATTTTTTTTSKKSTTGSGTKTSGTSTTGKTAPKTTGKK
jgi:hypothetical protein